MALRFSWISGGFVLAICGALWATGSQLENWSLRWVERQVHDRVGLNLSADRLSPHFFGQPGVVLHRARLTDEKGGFSAEADTVAMSFSPALFFRHPGAVVADIAGLRVTGDIQRNDWQRNSPARAADELQIGDIEISLSEPAFGRDGVSAARTHALIELGAPGPNARASLQIERAGGVLNLVASRTDSTQGVWKATFSGAPFNSNLAATGRFTERNGELRINAERFWENGRAVEGELSVSIPSDGDVIVKSHIPRLNLQQTDKSSEFDASGADGRPTLSVGAIDDIAWPGSGPRRLDATLICDDLKVGSAKIGDLNLQVVVQEQDLDLRASSDAFYAGKLRARYVQDGLALRHQLSATLSGVNLNSLLHDAIARDEAEGAMGGRIDIQASGRSLDGAAASAEGRSDFTLERASLDVASLALSDGSSALIGVVLRSIPRLAIERAAGSFAIHAGRAVTNDLAFFGPNVRGSGAGTVDLKDRLLDIQLIPEIRIEAASTLRSVTIPLAIEGPWASIQVKADASGLVSDTRIEKRLDGFELRQKARDGLLDFFEGKGLKPKAPDGR